MSNLPTGTVTFLFTDIEGSTKLAYEYPDAMPNLLARHHTLLRSAIESHNGHIFQIIGDAFNVAFHTAPDALSAALDAQRALHLEAWSPVPLNVRMGINTGTAQAGALDAVRVATAAMLRWRARNASCPLPTRDRFYFPIPPPNCCAKNCRGGFFCAIWGNIASKAY